LPDPAHVTGSAEEIEAAFEETYAALEARIHQLLALPVEAMAGPELSAALNRIGVEG
jgi:arsenate reductase